MRIMFVITSDADDGPGKSLANFISAIDQSEHDVTVGFLRRSHLTSIKAGLEAMGVRCVYFGSMGGRLGKIGWFDVLAVLRMLRIVKREKISVIHTHLHRATIFGWIISRFHAISQFATVHNTERHHFLNDPISRLVTTLENQAYCSAKNVIAVSNAVRTHLTEKLGVPGDKILTIHNTIRTYERVQAEPSASGRTNVVIGTMSRLEEQKGLIYLLEAFEIVSRRHPNIHLVIAGEGSQKHDIQNWIELRKIHNITLVGFQEPEKFLPTIDVFAIPSLWEGLPMALLEAMSFGLPILATNAGGIPEVVEDGKEGFVVPRGSSFHLSNALERFVVDDNLRLRMSHESLAKSKLFYSERLTSRLRELYHQQ